MCEASLKRFLSSGKLNLYLLAVWLVVFLFYSYLAFTVPHRSSFLSPDENNTYCVARQIRERNTIYLDSPLNEKLGMKIFRGRLYVETKMNKYTAFNSLGLSFLVAGGMYLGLTFFVVPFLASLGVVGIYLVAKELAGEVAGFFAAILYGLLPTNVFISNQILDATPSFAMYLLSLGSILTAMKKRSIFLSTLAGAALGLSFFIRQANAIYIFALLVFLACQRKKLAIRQWASFLLPSVAIGLATVTMNRLVYGSFYRSGQLAGSEAGTFYMLFPKLDLKALLHSLSTHLIAYLPLLLILGIAGYIMACRGRSGATLKPLNILMIILAAVTVLSYGSRSGTWSFDVFSITSSMARYFIPIYAVVIIYASLCLSNALSRGQKATVMLLISAILCSFALFTFGGLEYMNLQKLKRRAEINTQAKEALLERFDQPIVVFTKRYDKDLYDDVQVGLCYTHEDAVRNPDLKNLFPLVDIEKDILPTVNRLINDGYIVLAASDSPELLDALGEKGYKTDRVEEFPSLYLVRK